MKTTALFFGLSLISMSAHAVALTNAVVNPNSPSGSVSSASSDTLSSSEWQELRTARTEALKANPGLVTRATQLSEKMRQFQQKLNAAMVKTDPNIAPVLAKFAGNRPASGGGLPTSAK